MEPEKIYSTVARMSSFYDFCASVFGTRKSVRDFVSEIPFDKNRPVKILDAGCGTGWYTLAVLNQFENAHVTAFDLNPNLVAHLKRRVVQKGFENRVHLFTDDLQSSLLEIENQQFDLIITSGVLEYVPLEKTVKNISRFLVPGGYALSSPVTDTAFGRLVGRVYACKPYSQTENIEAFESHGHVLQKIVEIPWYLPASFKEAHIFQKALTNGPDY